MGPDTRVIPGHGPGAADRNDVREYQDMLRTIRGRVALAKRTGATLQEVQTTRPTREFDQGRTGGFVSPDDFVAAVYASLPVMP